MVKKLGLAKRFLLLVTPILTGSALAQLALGIAASPSLAATIAFSKATEEIDNFSHNPLDVSTLTDTYTNTIATSGQVIAEADAEADFLTNPSKPPYAYSSSFSTANGEGSNYSGVAQSLAEVIGYNFLVGNGETFSLDFKAILDLETSIDNPASEGASADGNLSLQLYDSTNRDNWIYLDSFTLSGNLTTLGDGDSLDYYKSASITFNPSGSSFDNSFGGTQEFADASVQGSFSRTFDSSTYLTLVEVKTNQATVQVPEPSSTLGLLFFGLIGVGYRVRRKHLERSQNLPINRS